MNDSDRLVRKSSSLTISEISEPFAPNLVELTVEEEEEEGKEFSVSNFGCQNPWTWLQNYFGGETKFRLKLSLFAFPFDLVLDCLTSVSHIFRGNYFEGILTYLIVFISGFIISVGFLAGNGPNFLINEAKRAGKFWTVLLVFPPGLLPFVIAYIRLHYEDKVSKNQKNDKNKVEDDEKLLVLKELNLKANWAEAVLEGKYQSLLQIIIILEDVSTFHTLLDYMPVLLTAWATFSHTMGIYYLVSEQYQMERKRSGNDLISSPVLSKCYGYTYTVVSLLSPALCVNGARNRFPMKEGETGETFEKILATFISFFAYYLSFGFIYLASLIMCKGMNRNESFSGVFHTNLLFLYAGCLYYYMVNYPIYPFQLIAIDKKCAITIFIQIFSAISSFLLSFVVRDFAQFGLNLMNEKICSHWINCKTKVQKIL